MRGSVSWPLEASLERHAGHPAGALRHAVCSDPEGRASIAMAPRSTSPRAATRTLLPRTVCRSSGTRSRSVDAAWRSKSTAEDSPAGRPRCRAPVVGAPGSSTTTEAVPVTCLAADMAPTPCIDMTGTELLPTEPPRNRRSRLPVSPPSAFISAEAVPASPTRVLGAAATISWTSGCPRGLESRPSPPSSSCSDTHFPRTSRWPRPSLTGLQGHVDVSQGPCASTCTLPGDSMGDSCHTARRLAGSIAGASTTASIRRFTMEAVTECSMPPAMPSHLSRASTGAPRGRRRHDARS